MPKTIVQYTDALTAAFMKQKVVAPVEPTTTASRAYAVDEYLMLNGSLYKVTASISQGDTIQSGVNVSATLLTDELGGAGVPSGGTAGQMLIKNSSTDGDASWQSLDSSPTSGSTKPITSGGVYTALENKQDTISGAATSVVSNNLTSSCAVVSNSSGKLAASDTTATELGYVHGVTASIQDQLNSKQSTLTFDSTPTASSSNPVTSGGVKAALDTKAVLSVTTTDPGEGSALAANTLLVVVEA